MELARPMMLDHAPTEGELRDAADVMRAIDRPPVVTTEHLFGDGTYSRLMVLGAGSMIIGKKHRYEHGTVMLYGDVEIGSTTGMLERMTGPRIFVTPADTTRVMIAHAETAWLTIHPNPTNTRDLAVLEADLIVPERDL